MRLLSLLLLIMTASCISNTSDVQHVDTLLISPDYLITTKTRIADNDPKLTDALDRLIANADAALTEGPFSVTHKVQLPPSGDRHDYASYSRYWWPDPNQPDGLPYIRRDGATNPASQNLDTSDRPRIGALAENCESLGLAYYLTGNESYAEKVAELLRVWFLDEETRMNPNVNHAQCRPGHNLGTKSGVLDGRLMIQALEASRLIEGSPALTEADREGLKKWAAAYFEWLTTADMALDEARSKNNHGTYYDVQAMYFALYADHRNEATRIAETFIERRLATQIQADGTMPEELARTRPLFYSMFNLHAMLLVAHMAEHVDVDIWQANDPNAPLRKALDHLVPYADPNIAWPTETLGSADRMQLFPILKMADQGYPEGHYLKKVETLPLTERSMHLSNLMLPIMR